MKEITTTTRAGAGAAPAGEGHEITRTERSASPPARSGRTIAVYGATGYTGTMVARELVRRGVEVVLAGRSRDALAALAASFPSSARIAVAALDEPAALRAALSGCDAVVNAAGPFSRSTRPVLAAALAKHCHYLDVSADPYVLRDVFAEADQPGRNAGIAIVPGISFFFVLSDLLAQVVSEQATDRLTSVDVGYALERWHFTPGSMAAFWDMVGQRLRFFDGALRDTTDRPRHGRFAFASPIGDRAVVEYPGGDVVTIPRHVATPRVSVSMTAATFAPRWLSWALPVLMSLLGGLSRSRFRRSLQAIAERVPRRQIEERRAATRFAVEVHARADVRSWTATVRGRHMYGLGAWLTADAAARVAAGEVLGRGVLAPAQAFSPRAYLDALAAHDLIDEVRLPAARPDITSIVAAMPPHAASSGFESGTMAPHGSLT